MFVFNSSIRNSKDANPNLQKEKKPYKQVVIDNMLHHQYVISQIIDTFKVLCTHKIYQIIIYSWKDVKIFRPALILFVYLEIDTVTREQDKTGCFLEFLRH